MAGTVDACSATLKGVDWGFELALALAAEDLVANIRELALAFACRVTGMVRYPTREAWK